MDVEAAISQVLEDEGLSSNLDEAEAITLTSWLTNVVKTIASRAASDEAALKLIREKKQLARKFAKVVACFRDQGLKPARQLAVTQQVRWPEQNPANAHQLLKALILSTPG